MRTTLLASLAALFVATFAASSNGTELSAAGGATSPGGLTYRAALGQEWDQSWMQSSTGRLTGYGDAGYTYWSAGSNGSAGHSLSFAPVFVYEFQGESVKPFIEAGIGVAVFSSTVIGEQNLGSSFNFEDRIGAGLKFKGGQKIGVRAVHYSNVGIKEPNDGIESFSLFYAHDI